MRQEIQEIRQRLELEFNDGLWKADCVTLVQEIQKLELKVQTLEEQVFDKSC